MNRVATPAAPRSTSCARARVLAAIVAAALIPPGCSTGGALSAPVDDVGEGQGTAPDALGAEAGAHAPTAPAPALSWRVSDRDTGETIPAKVVLVGVAGTADPGLSPSMLVLADSDDGYAAHNRIFSLSGIGGINPPAGTYEVWVSRGIEWSHHVERVVIGGPPVEVDAQLGHVIDTAGWLSADLHVHAEPSHDSVVPLPVRVLQFISEGVEMIVATDHNVITDYQPTIDALDAADLLASASGCEVTTPTFGHFGSYPLVRNPVRPFGGPPAVEGVLPQALFDAIHASSRLATIAVNHPTWGGRDYFNRGGLDAAAGKAAWKDFSWDFDAIEVLNGFHDPGRGLLDRNLGDFFALIDHGYIRTATGNSDTHLLRLNIGGYPRNYLRVAPDLPAAMTPALLSQAIQSRSTFFTTGPFVRLTVEGGTIGDTVRSTDGWVSVSIEVDATTWVSVSTVTLFAGGRVDRIWRAPNDRLRTPHGFAEPLRWTIRRIVPVEEDTHITVLVEGRDPLWPIVGERDEHVVTSLAFTNPVFVDVDGNGMFDAPLAKPERPRARR
jgi:hypothetical protein